jgi:GT2 family glycosyltransferase
MQSAVPQLAVIIPVYNGSSTIGQCLAALGASTFRNFEAIVVDDGSSDASAAIAERFPVRLVRLARNSGPGAARNAGVAVSSAPLLFFLDADIIVPPSFLAKVVDRIQAHPEFSGLFCSYGRATLPENTASRHKNLVHYWTHQNALVEAVTFCGGFGLLRREAFLAVAGFDSQQRFLEDVDLGYRLHLAGYRIFLAKDLQVTHAKVYTLGSFLRSDLFGRAAPWTRLMLKYRIFRNDLNTRTDNVLSVQVACLLPLSVVLDPCLRLTGGLALLFVWLNRSFLRVGAREYGFHFAVRSAFLCWLSYVASAAGLCLGAGAWLREVCASEIGKVPAPSQE